MNDILSFNKKFALNQIHMFMNDNKLPPYIKENRFLNHYDDLITVIKEWDELTDNQYTQLLDSIIVIYNNKNKIDDDNINYEELEKLKNDYMNITKDIKLKDLRFDTPLTKQNNRIETYVLKEHLGKILSKLLSGDDISNLNKNELFYLDILRQHKNEILSTIEYDISILVEFIDKWHLHSSPQGVILFETVNEIKKSYDDLLKGMQDATTIFDYVDQFGI